MRAPRGAVLAGRCALAVLVGAAAALVALHAASLQNTIQQRTSESTLLLRTSTRVLYRVDEGAGLAVLARQLTRERDRRAGTAQHAHCAANNTQGEN